MERALKWVVGAMLVLVGAAMLFSIAWFSLISGKSPTFAWWQALGGVAFALCIMMIGMRWVRGVRPGEYE